MRAAAARVQCAHNLKQIGIALHAFHDVNGSFPLRSFIGDGSWMREIGPFIERGNLTDWDWGKWWEEIYHSSLWAIGVGQPVKDSLNDGTGDPCPAKSCFSPGDNLSYCHVNHFWSFHEGGGNWLLCDGSVRFLAYSAGEMVIPAMATISGGEVVSVD